MSAQRGRIGFRRSCLHDGGSDPLTRTTPTSWIPYVGSVATVFAAVVVVRNDGGAADDRCCPAYALTSGCQTPSCASTSSCSLASASRVANTAWLGIAHRRHPWRSGN